ncbi:MAG: hypothetical protein WBA45_10480 [Microthrixaceae bacterium]
MISDGASNGAEPTTGGVTLHPAEVISLLALTISLLVGAVLAVRHGWVPISDEALIELRVRDVPAHLPLSGVYSKFGWNHPGPSQFYLLSLFYFVGRSSSSALLVGSMATHLMFGVVAWRAIRAVDRTLGLIVLAGVGLVLASTSPQLLRTPWNPYVVLIGGFAIVALGWSLAERKRFGAVLVLPVATYLIQSHVVTAPMTLIVVVTGAVLALARRAGRAAGTPLETTDPVSHATETNPMPWLHLGVGAALAALMWLPPLVQQLTGDPGNLTRLLSTGGDGASVGFREATGVVSQAFAAWPSTLNNAELAKVIVNVDLALPVWLLVPIIGAVLAVRRRDHAFLRGLTISAAALVGVWISMAATSGGLFNYLTLGLRPIAIATICIGIGSIFRSLPGIPQTIQMSALAVVICVLSASIGVQQIGAENPFASYAPTVRALERVVEEHAAGRSIDVSSAADIHSAEVAIALMLQLEREGYEVSSAELGPSKVGEHRSHGGEYQVQVAPIQMRAHLLEQGWEPLLEYDPLSRAEQREFDRLKGRRDAAQAEFDSGSSGQSRTEFLDTWMRISDQMDKVERGRVAAMVVGRTRDGGD